MTTKFGDDAEYYVSSLFEMVKNPNGTRRPDLVAKEGSFDPKLTIEMKSGRGQKGVLNDSQLHYALTLEEDYLELFGEESPRKNGMPNGVNWESVRRGIPSQGIAYYYDVIEREDSLMSFDIMLPFHTIKIKWGNQFIVPHEMGFYYFAIGKSRRTGEPIRSVIDGLFKIMKHDADEGCSHYAERRDTQSWQNIYTKDILALFHKDSSLTTKKPNGVDRIEMLKRVYPEVDDLERITIEGPNKTIIHILAEPRHHKLFKEQLSSVARLRKKTIEEISAGRREYESLLQKISYQDFVLAGFEEEILKGKCERYDICLNNAEVETLTRLKQWCAPGEIPFQTYSDEVPF